MPRLTETRRRDRHQNLLEAARVIFQAKGYAAASISEIAKTAQVSDGLIYRYFSDKRAMLAAVLEDFLEGLIAQAESAVGEAEGFRAKLEAIIRTNLQVYAQDPEMCALFIREQRDASDYRGSPIHGLMRRYTELLSAVVRDGIAAGDVRPDLDVRLLRDFLFGGMEHLAWNALASGAGIAFENIAAQLTEMLTSGIARTAPEKR